RVVVQEAGWNEDHLVGDRGEGRTAATAERTDAPGRGFVAAYVITAAQPAEVGRARADRGRESRAVGLPAHRAVTVPHELEGRVDLEGDVPAQAAASCRHRLVLPRGLSGSAPRAAAPARAAGSPSRPSPSSPARRGSRERVPCRRGTRPPAPDAAR